MSTNQELPHELRSRILGGVHYDSTEREDILQTFLTKFLKLNSEDPENFSKTVVFLDKTCDKKVNRRRNTHARKKLTLRKRKELGLYFLGKKSLKFSDLLPLHKLWKEYMIQYMNFDELSKQNWTNNLEDPNFDQVSVKLYRADYHGCRMSVSKATCPSYVGTSGIVVMETKNCFKLLGSDNIVRIIPKSSCVFTFKLHDFEFTFFGKNLQVKPAERSSKKLKTVYTSELQL